MVRDFSPQHLEAYTVAGGLTIKILGHVPSACNFACRAGKWARAKSTKFSTPWKHVSAFPHAMEPGFAGFSKHWKPVFPRFLPAIAGGAPAATRQRGIQTARRSASSRREGQRSRCGERFRLRRGRIWPGTSRCAGSRRSARPNRP